MTILDLVPYQMRRCGTKNGGEYHSQCPMCGHGSKSTPQTSDRFMVWPLQGKNGTWYCRSCEKGGDAIEYLRYFESMSFADACAKLGQEPSPAASISKAKRPPVWSPSVTSDPAELWREHAAKFAQNCHTALLSTTAQMAWLADRGISREQVIKFHLGWNDKDFFRPRSSWGLPPLGKSQGKLKKLWIPRGLVIPWSVDDKLHRLRIRKPDGDLRYYVVPGSGRSPLQTNPAAEAYVVVESELDGILVDGVAGDLVGVMAMGNSTAKPDNHTAPGLQQALHISVALDSDTPRRNERTGRLEAAGAKASVWWLKNFKTADRTPIIGGKDPGEAYKAGVDVRTWVMAGLPPRFTIRRQAHTEPEQHAAPVANSPAAPPEIIDGTTADGRQYTVTRDPATWRRLSAAGEIVFSSGEIQRLHTALGGKATDKQTALLMDIKELIPGAYISVGRPKGENNGK